jgi:lipopolysaccharide/colanic/teichoic acid biosynthesis glycosyltransferase
MVYHNLWERLPVPMVPVIEDEHMFLTVHEEPLEDPFNRGVKRLYDIVVALHIVALVLPPLCLVVWIVQRLQAPGPLMFTRPRGGHRRREFGMLKFRSMYANEADAKQESKQASAGDPRIYPFGRFLRKSSLDEFPQFWNVLVGDMSIVGPRPHLPTHDYEFSLLAKTYRTRQLVKPGITGLAQVRGYRGEISDPELLRHRVQLDIHYITHWSIWLDAQITLQTFLQVFRPPKSAL